MNDRSQYDALHGDEPYLPQGFSIDSVSAEDAEREAAQRSQQKIKAALEYARPLVDEPFITVIWAIKDEFGLTAKELETVIHKWTMESIASVEKELNPADVLRAYEGQ